ncbi:peptide ABC transporter substrate-binding protein [Candidatus Desantisbacteria bacterium CG_4_10_14_0_8_um_filter_48_22]|uniref:Peptide ABC transporter substrate-binding protein n=1 Tax=Candidatus Desantisbacteria bacterium CG_4_10_14_0_8_um_filter_48_22 TaxID=1974543 RepID=A0A2M7SE66_9BACT|nr:MAG: hypothetical protein AUJ67_02380 [Candidatus Desantisbacteria bacterium CG1_02_49_89]PIV57444.1 MAG: peptide ABC transporter substrate-binding protein [Candidatus Desantisbacteria bacterium CG02_land_8_20_14_3_00_49_13]PIZ17774.1 MAG: peptide ABC transporter substrate-binding protein [Candidatus Desantisbacteria bacterium CG_4_10_14_0_8_um_filter_48_22]PJB27186.1 MAG: peptide ABC transporter substrate-binding protein [Candidatus Desantisbacteria bacterium CG_4_9_14_3_um_filter_50_7]
MQNNGSGNNGFLLETRDLSKFFPVEKNLRGNRGFVRAVNKVTLNISRGETLGLVGESGCGKSTLARLILRLIEPDEGDIYFDGVNLRELSKKDLRKIRGRMQIIFQDPYASLNPRLTLKSVLNEILRVHGIPPADIKNRACGLLDLVGLDRNDMNKYPHEFSGGQRQRIGIARALAINPEFIVADEPVSSLDVSIQAQIINLMVELQRKFSLTYLFISHDLGVVRYISDRIAVMYAGRIMETAPASEMYDNPLHPYTKLLLASAGGLAEEKGVGINTDTGDTDKTFEDCCCKYYGRCQKSSDKCKSNSIDFKEVSKGHFVRCINY